MNEISDCSGTESVRVVGSSGISLLLCKHILAAVRIECKEVHGTILINPIQLELAIWTARGQAPLRPLTEKAARIKH